MNAVMWQQVLHDTRQWLQEHIPAVSPADFEEKLRSLENDLNPMLARIYGRPLPQRSKADDDEKGGHDQTEASADEDVPMADLD